jgi:phage FluMu protein Com
MTGTTVLVGIRCPYCNRLVVRASVGAIIQVTCPRCRATLRREVEGRDVVE